MGSVDNLGQNASITLSDAFLFVCEAGRDSTPTPFLLDFVFLLFCYWLGSSILEVNVHGWKRIGQVNMQGSGTAQLSPLLEK